jgi:hypothetical protein
VAKVLDSSLVIIRFVVKDNVFRNKTRVEAQKHNWRLWIAKKRFRY